MAFYRRFAEDALTEDLQDSPAVLVVGPRQSGKTTLVKKVAAGIDYLTLDDPETCESARVDPVRFVRGLDSVVIDEIQRAPGLLPVIKRSIDEDRRPGRFLLTGSANVMTLPGVSESLAGRLALVTLLPLSRAEILGRPPKFIEACFAGEPPAPAERLGGNDLVRAAVLGGYPDAHRRGESGRARRWCMNYVQTIMQRDVRDISHIQKLAEMPQLLNVLAHHSGNLFNATEVGRDLRLHHTTIDTYTTILEQIFLVKRVQPWFRNELKRVVSTPKLHFLDTGLLAAMRDISENTIARDRRHAGVIFETFAYAELRKQAAWIDWQVSIYHYRDKDKVEIDFILENANREVVGVEVKASASAANDDFKGLRKLRDATGTDFKAGILLHDGERTLPFGDRLFAAPFSTLWS
jgi:predicted AAA+ superfamily ATPase